MISFRQRLQCLPFLFGGISVGLLLELSTRISGGTASIVFALVAILPFFLAALTGVAKNTTA